MARQDERSGLANARELQAQAVLATAHRWSSLMRHFLQGLATALLTISSSAAQSPLDIDQDAAKLLMPGVAEAGHGDPALIEIRVNAIQQELAVLGSGHEWAGEYYFGDGLGANLSLHLAPQTGFAVTWHGCMGLYGANEGQVKVAADGVLNLDFRWKNLSGRFANFPKRLLPVRWGDRHYLADADNLARFVNAIHAGSEPRNHAHGGLFLRRGDEQLAAPGLPDLPSAWLHQIRLQPLEFAVVSLDPLTYSAKNPKVMDLARAELQVLASKKATGQSSDLMPGIELRRSDTTGDYSQMTVLASSAGRVQVEWAREFADCDSDAVPLIGRVYSTGALNPETVRRAGASTDDAQHPE
jgi:hypothetical protein